jgi:hypothetical protein
VGQSELSQHAMPVPPGSDATTHVPNDGGEAQHVAPLEHPLAGALLVFGWQLPGSHFPS